MVIFIGWLVGVLLAGLLGAAALAALALPLPTILVPFALPISLPIVAVLVLLLLAYLGTYVLASVSIAPLLPPVTLPLTVRVRVPTPPGASVPLGAVAGELFARGVAIGMTALLDAALLMLVPIQGPALSTCAFVVVSLAIVTPVSRSPIYHGFLGWTGWVLPVSYLATAVGLLLFVLNAPLALAFGGIGAFRIDWSTGVIETSGGILALPFMPTSYGAFSLGNFTFVRITLGGTSFLVNGLSAHETGHTLNTAALGGVVLWINAIDENVPPVKKLNLAYGELTAESHAQGLPAPPPPAVGPAEFFVRSWG